MNIFEQIRDYNIENTIKVNTIKDFKQKINLTIWWELESIQCLCKTKNEMKIFGEFIKLFEKIDNL